MRSFEPRSALVKSSPSCTLPLITLKYCTSPICGSTAVLKKYKEVGPLESGFTTSPRVLCTGGISSTNGTTLPRNSIKRRTPMSFPAHTQNTGNIPREANPLRIPSRISSSVRESCSKNFSIKVSSCSAAASTNALCMAVDFLRGNIFYSGRSAFRPPRIFFHQKYINQRIEIRSGSQRILNGNYLRTVN